MEFLETILSRPVLIGLHLGFGIIGIDAYIWYLGEIVARAKNRTRLKIAALIGLFSFVLSWIIGGYYYVVYYGSLVKPVIKAGLAPWAHAIFMETKEHIFLFIIPLAVTATLIAFLDETQFEQMNMRRVAIFLSGMIAFLGLLIGIMGYIVSAAARFG